jgi:hypothetical protein
VLLDVCHGIGPAMGQGNVANQREWHKALVFLRG